MKTESALFSQHLDQTRPIIGVSACLLGHPVRYDGTDKHTPFISSLLSDQFTLQPLCPESGAGLGTPREPVQLVQIGQQQRVRQVSNPEIDVTDPLLAYSDQLPVVFSGLILKARSPSCGYLSTPLYDEAGKQIDTLSGLFVQHMLERFPELPVCSEEDFFDKKIRSLFLDSVWTCWKQHF